MSSHGKPKYAVFRRGKGRMRSCLYPADDRAREALAGLPESAEVAVRLSTDRSLLQHNRFWALLDLVAKATEWETPEKLLVGLKMRLGYFDIMLMPNGKKVPVPHSIAFSAMSQADFQVFQDRAMNVLVTEVCPGLDVEQLAIEAGVKAHAREHVGEMLRKSLADSEAIDAPAK